MLQLKKWN